MLHKRVWAGLGELAAIGALEKGTPDNKRPLGARRTAGVLMRHSTRPLTPRSGGVSRFAWPTHWPPAPGRPGTS